MKEDEDVLLFFHFCVTTSMGISFSLFFCNFLPVLKLEYEIKEEPCHFHYNSLTYFIFL